jgi:hypothetical protein
VVRARPEELWARCVAAVLSVAVSGCEESAERSPEPAPSQQKRTSTSAVVDAGKQACCMGLNECRGKGGCAVPESHACAAQNECRGRGGCRAHCPK